MSDFDVIIRGGTLVSFEGERVTDIGITDGKITALGNFGGKSAGISVDANNLHVFPGLIDSHVHFNEPGRAEWEGIETGSRALAAGGGTMFFDMPLNSHPPTIDAGAFDEKVAAAKNRSLTDFALWGGLVPGNHEHLEALSERGVIGFKAFMSNSGIDDFPRADDHTLHEGMKRAARLGKVVAVHAESENITSEFAEKAFASGRISARDYLDSRPIIAELDAIQRALDMAGYTGCALHVVHVSSAAGLALIASARNLGLDVSCETCPHYLTLTEDDVMRLGAIAKCAPPLRGKFAQDALWQYVLTNQVTVIGSDHSPSPPEMKRDANFFKVWGGISGVQHTLPLLITEGNVNRQMALGLIAKVTSFNVAQRFRLPRGKGRVAVGADADLALIDLKQSFEVKADDLHYRHRHSPYVGRALTGRVVQTILRGQTVFKDGKPTAPPSGRLVKPQANR